LVALPILWRRHVRACNLEIFDTAGEIVNDDFLGVVP
jgi:hypothetical protein